MSYVQSVSRQEIIGMFPGAELHNRFLCNSSHVSLHYKTYLVLSHRRNTNFNLRSLFKSPSFYLMIGLYCISSAFYTH